MKNKTQKKPKRSRSPENSELKAYLISAIKSLVVFLALLLLSTFICYKADASDKYYFIVMIIICSISCFFGGIFASSKLKEKGIICGLLGSLPIMVPAVIVSTIIGRLSIKLLISCIAMLLFGMVGGIFTANMRR